MRIVAALAAVTMFGLGAPQAAPAAQASEPGCPPEIAGSAPRLHPEGVTYDWNRDRFLVGSVTHGTVSVVRPDGSVRTLVEDPVLITTMGLAVDARRGRLFVVNGDVGISDHTTPETLRKTAGLGIYDLRTGDRIAYHDLGAIDAPSQARSRRSRSPSDIGSLASSLTNPSREHFGNDVALAPDGTAFVTDSFNGAVYRVPTRGAPSILLRDDRLLPVVRGNGANGIVRRADGLLLIAHSSGRALYRFDGSTLSQVSIAEPIGAPDGLLFGRDATLHAIDNTAANRVVTLRSTDDWATATLVASQSWPVPAPTTMARGRCGIYVLSGRLDQLDPGSDEFNLGRLGR